MNFEEFIKKTNLVEISKKEQKISPREKQVYFIKKELGKKTFGFKKSTTLKEMLDFFEKNTQIKEFSSISFSPINNVWLISIFE